MARVRIASDVGGTFTDSLAYDEDQAVFSVCKVPTIPDNRAVGTVRGLKQALRLLGRTGAEVNYVGHGMTTATNAVIQRKGAKIAFISNEGFRDMLEIGRQNRPRLYDYRVSRTAPIARRADRYTVSGRLDYTGTELQPVDTEQIKTVAAQIRAGGAEAVAVCLLHAYADPVHEQTVKSVLEAELPGVFICISTDIIREFREYERASTVALNAYLIPIMDRYLASLEALLADTHKGLGVPQATPVMVMEASGGLMTVASARANPVHTVLSGPAGGVVASAEIDAITLEVLRNALQSIAEEMGAVLKNTSFSPNIKERMDASCAIFDAQAGLVAQAEHVPVHLGSMLVALRQILERIPSIEEGDVILVNDPYIGGAHLPDITLIGAVFADSDLIGFITARAHHSDVGGMEPGSMPGRSTEVYQEGVVIPPVKLYRRGKLMDDIMSMVLANVRTPDERRGDLNAQLAALRTGQKRLLELAGKHGKALFTAGLTALQNYAERRIRKHIAELPDGSFLNAKRPAAVCAGNTEATHRVCDTVLKAAAQFAPGSVHAASQGTMNLIGIGGIDPRYDRPYTYIETIAGGEGGKPWGDGTDGVQCNMTNTMNTPVESLEITYPLRVERYEFRPGSGGDGKYRGGLGVTRSVRSVAHEARVSLSADRRIFQPYGLHGGGAGQVGEHTTIDSSGAVRKLPGKTTFSLPPDSIVVVNTPGGGGWGDPKERAPAARESDLVDEKH